MYLNVGHGGGTGDTHDKDGINMAKTPVSGALSVTGQMSGNSLAGALGGSGMLGWLQSQWQQHDGGPQQLHGKQW